MEDKLKKMISDMFPDLLKQYLGSFANTVVPQHRHNGVDSLAIPIGNILINASDGSITTNTGIPLISGADQYNIYVLNTGGVAPLVIQPNQHAFDGGGANLYFGLSAPFSGTVFNRIFMNVDGAALSEEITLSATDTVGGGTNGAQMSVTAGQVDMQATDGTDSAQADLLPLTMQYTSSNPAFQIKVNSDYVPTSTGSTGGGVVPAGTVALTINGTTYNVLHT